MVSLSLLVLFESAVQGDYVMSHLLLLFQALRTQTLCDELLVIIILNILKDHFIQ